MWQERWALWIVSAWFWTTALVDFVIVPALFQRLRDLKSAGALGMHYFTTYNRLEALFAILLCALIFKICCFKSNWRNKLVIIFSISLIILVAVYNFYLSPKIISLTELMHNDTFAFDQRSLYEEKHRFFHHLYVRLDSLKILFLLFINGHFLFPSKRSVL